MLTDLMQKWSELKIQLEQVEQEITEEVLALGKTQVYGNVEASYKKSSTNGKYDYEGMCREVEPDTELVSQHTVYPEPYIDFKSLAEAARVPMEIKQKYYSSPVDGEPKVTVKFKK